MNDERHKKDTLTSAVLQEALLNMPLGVIYGMRSHALYLAESSAWEHLMPLSSIQYRPR